MKKRTLILIVLTAATLSIGLIVYISFAPDSSRRSEEKTVCLAKGDKWESRGFGETCVHYYTDGNKQCIASSECESNHCIVAGVPPFTKAERDIFSTKVHRAASGYIQGTCLSNTVDVCYAALLDTATSTFPNNGQCWAS